MGLVLSAAFFALVGAAVLWTSGVRPLRLSVLAAFIVAAQGGLLAFAAAYGLLFANADNQLTSAPAVIGMLLGMPVAGTLSGWLVARRLARRWRAGRTAGRAPPA